MPTIQQQLDHLKATLAAILDGIERLELQLDPHSADDEEFTVWANGFDQRWANRNQPTTDEADPAANNHPAAWR